MRKNKLEGRQRKTPFLITELCLQVKKKISVCGLFRKNDPVKSLVTEKQSSYSLAQVIGSINGILSCFT